jgi:hypothetical protein
MIDIILANGPQNRLRNGTILASRGLSCQKRQGTLQEKVLSSTISISGLQLLQHKHQMEIDYGYNPE